MNNKRILIGMVLFCMLLTSCGTPAANENTEAENTVKQPTVKIEPNEDIDSAAIQDDEAVYANDDPQSIVYFYVTVRQGAKGSDTDHTFAEVNSVKKFEDYMHVNVEVKADALVQAGDETGPLNQMLGFGETRSNATIEVRGNSTSAEPQKSYTLKLYDNTALWRGQKKIALVKSVYDSTRFRNKLFFDLLKDIPDVSSLRTQFVRLFIKDETSGKDAFKDYGLFTQTETPNKRYLNNHGLGGSGYLYKARSFNFELNDSIKNFDDPEFDLEDFETILSCSGKEDNTRLIEMIEAVNDYHKDIDAVINTYFDRDNYLTWLAYNILMGNIDTTMQNFYLYSPLNGNKWYFIPWDGDGSLFRYEYQVRNLNEVAEWEKGISNYWGVSLHQKFLSIENNRDQLTQKIELLKKEYLTKEKVTGFVSAYDETIRKYALNMPDLLHQKVTKEQRTNIINKLYNEIEGNYESYYETLQNLMPFFLDDTAINGKSVRFSWGESYDMQGKLVDYTFYLSKTPEFSEVIYKKSDIHLFELNMDNLKPGKYYWKVIASTEDGRTATAFNQIYVDDISYDGIESLVIE